VPLELIATAPRTPELRSYEEPPLGAEEVRLRSTFSAVKHGTQLRAYRADTRDISEPFDRELGLHLRHGSARPPGWMQFPMALGTATVGEVIAVGAAVDSFAVGDVVYGDLPIRETHTMPAAKLRPVPAGMDPHAVVCGDPARVALSGVRDSALGLGDRVLVTGLGAIGQMALQLARLQGAAWVAGADPIARRRALASRHGADLVIDPTTEDTGLVVKQATGKAGADAVIETSGSYAGLNDALRAAAYGATVVSVAYYPGAGGGLSLEGEWHRNRINLLSSRDVSAPHRLTPRWDSDRLLAAGFALLQQGRLRVEGLLDPVVPLADSAEAYRQIDLDPGTSIKLGVTYQ
jgi:threonine dehydrogenase-like Zn-dependent dehydrogenase